VSFLRAGDRHLNIQLWSYNYEPEPTGIGPVSAVFARLMRERGHEVQVVAAHPHYPEPRWGTRRRPYRERRDGISVLRLPLAVGRATTFERVRQELTFTAAQSLASPLLPTPDVVVAVSPSFPALAPAMVNASVRRRPWVLWLQDILPEGAASTGLVEPGKLLRSAQAFEALAYRSARRIVVISRSFERNLLAKGVPPWKLRRIYNPATHELGAAASPAGEAASPASTPGPPRLLSMGNIGHSQGLTELVAAFERSAAARAGELRLVIVGAGVASTDVRAAKRTDSVELRGLLSAEELRDELGRATLGVVSQRPDVAEFNLPSKLMNYMARGLPVLAAVRADSEVAGLLEESGAGWVTDCADPREFAARAAEVVRDRSELARRGEAGLEYAREHFAPERSAELYERVLLEAVGLSATRRPARAPLTRGARRTV